MPKKKEYNVASGFIVILYIIIFILFLKIFHIISDPPNELDLLMNVAIAIISGLVGWGIKWFMNLSNRIETLERSLQDETKSIKAELVHLRDYLELSTRIAKLEASAKKEKEK